MVDYLTQPSSGESSITKMKKIRSDLKTAKDKQSKKREKFAKNLTGAYLASTAGNAMLQNSLERYKLRNQDQLNQLKSQKSRAKDFIASHNKAIETSGTLEAYYYNTLEPIYKTAIEGKSGESYRYDSSQWTDELNAAVNEKVKNHKQFLADSYSIADSDPDKLFQSIVDTELPSNLFSYMTKGVKNLINKETPETLEGREKENVTKLLDRPVFAAYKNFKNSMEAFSKQGVKGLDNVLAQMDTAELERKWTNLTPMLKMNPVEKQVATPDGPKTEKSYVLTAVVLKSNSTTGETEMTAVKGEYGDGMKVDGGSVPAPIIEATKLTAYNSVLSPQGQSRLTQLLSKQEYQLNSEKAYFQVIQEGIDRGVKEGEGINPYLKPTIDESKIAETVMIHLGEQLESAITPPKRIDEQYFLKDGTFNQEQFDLDMEEHLSLIKDLTSNAALITKEIVTSISIPNLLEDPALPKP